MIEFSDFSVIRNGRKICSVPELSISAGERVAIVGANGSGKTTLLRVLSGLDTKYQGRLSVSGSQDDRVYVHQ